MNIRLSSSLLAIAVASQLCAQEKGEWVDLFKGDSFELKFEFNIAHNGNSGIKYRAIDNDGRALGCEYQIIDDDNYRDNKSLYVGKTHLSWPGREGIKKITYNGKPYLQAEAVTLTKKGFIFRFNSEITIPEDQTLYKIESYRIAYHSGYGSKNYDLESEPCATITAKGKELIIELKQDLKADRIYDTRLPAEIKIRLESHLLDPLLVHRPRSPLI